LQKRTRERERARERERERAREREGGKQHSQLSLDCLLKGKYPESRSMPAKLRADVLSGLEVKEKARKKKLKKSRKAAG